MTEEELFHAALAKSSDERAAFLNQACSGNDSLRAAVEALLMAHQAPGSFLNTTPPDATRLDLAERQDFAVATNGNITAAEEHTSGSGSQRDARDSQTATADYRRDSAADVVIGGRFALQEKIGEGGMGEVWVAKQLEPVKRRVAVKLIKTGMDTRAVLQRFEQERQALALMDHPNIAKVFDGGMTADGHPFFVMELVNGLPLNRFCDAAKLTPRQRLELFVPICQAVQHAHQKGIVHRDLKPANILVTTLDSTPVPKIIDFGVAKAIAGKLTEESIATGFGAVVGTLEYMSPEQAGFSSEDIDTRSDVYSLGVILYELLTGLKPVDSTRLRVAALTEMIRIIREEEPSKPSTRVSADDSLPSVAALRQTEPRNLVAFLRGELDCVVMKCLDKQRDRRYETANALARDIQRFLNNEVVEARPPSSGYRLQKYVKRNKVTVIAVGLILCAFLIGTIGTTLGLFEALRQKGIARQEATKNAALAERERIARLDAVDKGKQALENLAIAEAQRDRADRQFQLARKAVEDYLVEITEDESLRQSDFHELRVRLLELAVPFYEEFLRESADAQDVQAERARALGRLADIKLEMGSFDHALELLNDSLALWTQLASQAPSDPEINIGRIAVLERIGRSQLMRGNHAEAERIMLQRIALSETLAQDNPDNLALRHTLSTGYTDMSKLLMESGRMNEAKDFLIKSRQLDQELSLQLVGQIEPKIALATTLHNLGMLYWQLGDRSESEKTTIESTNTLRQLVEQFPYEPEVRQKFAGSLDHLAAFYAQIGRLAEAESHFHEGLSQYTKLTEDLPRVPQYRQELAGCLANLATLKLELNQTEEAHRLLTEAITIYEKLVDEQPGRSDLKQELAFFLSNRAIVLLNLKKPAEAVAECARAVEIQEALLSKSPEMHDNFAHLGKSLTSLGMIYENTNELVQACNAYRKAAQHLKTALEKKPDHPFFQNLLSANSDSLARCCNNLAYRQAAHPAAEQRDGAAALANATEACELTEWKNWRYLDTLAAAHAENGDFEGAVKWQSQAIQQLPWLNILSRSELQSRLRTYEMESPFRDEKLD